MAQIGSSSYLILYQFSTDDPNSKGFLRCKNIEQTFNTITKLAIYLHEGINGSQDITSFKSIIMALKMIPFLKVYQSEPNALGELKQTNDFCKQYRSYFKSKCHEAENYYHQLELILNSEQQSKKFLQKILKSRASDQTGQIALAEKLRDGSITAAPDQ